MIALAAQRHAQKHVCRRKPRIQLKGAAKRGRCASKIAKLSFGQPQLSVKLC